MKNKQQHAATQAIRANQLRTSIGEHSEAVFLTSGYVFDSAQEAAQRFAGDDDGPTYGRISNPTVQAFEQRMAVLEYARHGVATATGMAAINAVMTALLSSGDHIIASSSLFGATIGLFDKVLARFGVTTSYVDVSQPDGWAKAVQSNTKLLFLETPTNPLCELIDIQAVAQIAQQAKAILVVDNTYGTPVLQNPLLHGADIVVHSATKYIDGQGRAMAGMICLNDEDMHDEIFSIIRTAGATLSPMNAWVMNQGLHTLALRMAQHSSSALQVAQWLQQQKSVSQVFYPGLDSHPQQHLVEKQQSASGGMLSFEIKGGRRAAWKLIDRCKLVSISVNLGDSRSIITHPASTSHARLSDEQRARCGVTDSLIRFSVGLEHAQDIIDDLAQSLN